MRWLSSSKAQNGQELWKTKGARPWAARWCKWCACDLSPVASENGSVALEHVKDLAASHWDHKQRSGSMRYASRQRIRKRPIEGHFGQFPNTEKGGGGLSDLGQTWRTSEMDLV